MASAHASTQVPTGFARTYIGTACALFSRHILACTSLAGVWPPGARLVLTSKISLHASHQPVSPHSTSTSGFRMLNYNFGNQIKSRLCLFLVLPLLQLICYGYEKRVGM